MENDGKPLLARLDGFEARLHARESFTLSSADVHAELDEGGVHRLAHRLTQVDLAVP